MSYCLLNRKFLYFYQPEKLCSKSKPLFFRRLNLISSGFWTIFVFAMLYIYLAGINIQTGIKQNKIQKEFQQNHQNYLLLEEKYIKNFSQIYKIPIEELGFVKAEKPKFVRTSKVKIAEIKINIP